MADKNANEHASAGQAGTGSAPDEKAGVGAPAIPWKKVWPLPALIAGTTLFMGGAYMAIKTRPRPDPTTPLKRAESLVEARKFEEAIKVLNTDVKRFVDLGSEAGVTKAHKAAYHLAMARSFSGAQEQLGFSRAENHRAVVEQYQRAEELGVEIHGADVTRIVESLIALGKIEEALRRVRALPLVASAGSGVGHGGGGSPAHAANTGHSEHSEGEGAKAEGESGLSAVEGGAPEGDGLSEAERRVRLTKLVVEANLKSPTPRDDLTLELLAELGGMPRLSDTDRVWVLARQAELLLAAGRAEDAIVKLLPRIRVRAGAESAPEAEGELYLLLGRAYFDAGQTEAATKQLIEAARLLGEFNPKRAETDLILGKIMQSTGDLEGAKERFSLVVQEFSSTPSYLPALLGLAEVEGAVGGSSASAGDDTNKELESSIERYAQIVEASKTSVGVPRTVSRERVTSSLMERYQDRFQSGDLRNALRFAQLAESIYADEDVPGVVHMALARAHRRVADQTLGAAQEKGGPDFKITDLNAVERTEIKQHYLAAAGHFKAYAGLVAAVDNRAYGDALWSAGDSFDLAGDLEEAKRVFSAYADGASDDDARKPESRFRLAQVFQAQRDYASAAGVYRSLLDGGGGSSRGSIWGDQSIVPLARCILSDSDAGNDDEAEALLLSVVDGNEASPDAAEFREALIELGRMYYYGSGSGGAAGKSAKAIERLTEAVKRYPQDRRNAELRYWLADAQRLSAAQIGRELTQGMPQATRQELERTRAERLRSAVEGFMQARAALEQRPESKRSELERVYLRNAYFYIGDCAFDMQDYDAAVKSYDAARTRYTDDPASLVAMVQIVNAYVAQRRWAEARTANERATQHLARFPDAVWNRPDLPMERKHWERWLESRTLLDQAADQKQDRTANAEQEPAGKGGQEH